MKGSKVIGYVRVATKDPGDIKIKRQRDEIIQQCIKEKLDLITIFEDNGASGATFDRNGWKDMEEFLLNNHKDILSLIVSDLSRISRNISLGLEKTRYLNQILGISIKIIREKKNNIFERSISKRKRGRSKRR